MKMMWICLSLGICCGILPFAEANAADDLCVRILRIDSQRPPGFMINRVDPEGQLVSVMPLSDRANGLAEAIWRLASEYYDTVYKAVVGAEPPLRTRGYYFYYDRSAGLGDPLGHLRKIFAQSNSETFLEMTAELLDGLGSATHSSSLVWEGDKLAYRLTEERVIAGVTRAMKWQEATEVSELPLSVEKVMELWRERFYELYSPTQSRPKFFGADLEYLLRVDKIITRMMAQ